MFRAQILLEDWQHQQLKRLALQEKRSLSEMVREWVSEKLNKQSSRRGRKKDPLFEAAGMLKGKLKENIDVTRLDDYIYHEND